MFLLCVYCLRLFLAVWSNCLNKNHNDDEGNDLSGNDDDGNGDEGATIDDYDDDNGESHQ